MEALNQIFLFLISLFNGIGLLYTSSFILGSVLALFILRKLVSIFKRVLP